ncbi:hypothetical protein K2Y11_11950 [bacterium]|nr:hypothetical protein [bacterium]
MKAMWKGALLSALLVVPSVSQAGYLNGIMYRHATTTPTRHSSYVVRPMYREVIVTQPAVATTPNRTSYSSAFQAPAGQAQASAPTTLTILVPIDQSVMVPSYRRAPTQTRTQEIEHGREVTKGFLEK